MASHHLRRLATTLAAGLVLTLVQALLAAGPALAATTTTLDFDALADGTVVDDEFTGDGVTFTAPDGALGATGLPVVVDAPGQAHTDPNLVESTCSGCEFVPRSIRADLAVTAAAVAARVGTGAGCSSSTVSLRAYAVDGTLLATDSAAVTSSSMQAVSVADPGDGIAFVRVVDDTPGCEIRVDTLEVTHPDVPPPPDFSITVETEFAEVANGEPARVEITLSRVNGSTGDVDFDTGPMPDFVSADFEPDPVPGTGGSTTIVLTAHNYAFVDGPTDFEPFTVTATPTDPGAGSASRTLTMNVRVVPSLTVRGPDELSAPVCGRTSAEYTLTRFRGFTEEAELFARGLHLVPGIETTFDPPTSPAGTTEFTRHTMALALGPDAVVGDEAFHASARVSTAPFTTQDQDVVLHVTEPSITSVSPATVSPGQQVTIEGTGFCEGTEFFFGNDLASVTPPAAAYDADRTSVTMRVPRLATAGTIRAVAGTVVQEFDPYEVRHDRKRLGFRFDNYESEGVDHQIMIDTYGRDEVNFKIDFCWPFGCTVTTDLIDPFAALAMLIFNEAVGKNGSCFGWAATAVRMARGQEPMAPYPPAGADLPWDLDGTVDPSPALDDTIAGWHTVQLSTEFLRHWITEGVGNGSMSRGAFKDKVRELVADGPVMLSMARGDSGHAVTAYRFRDLGPGAFELDVVDPNIPFLAAEEDDTTGVTHRDRLALSTFRMEDGVWTFRGAFDETWTGGQAELKLVSADDWPTDPTLPIHPGTLLSLVIPLGSDGGTVTDSRGRTLEADGDGTMTDGTVLPNLDGGNGTGFAFVLPQAAGGVTYRSTQESTGSYGQGYVGDGFVASVRGIDGVAGQTDAIGADPGSGTLSLDPATPAGDLIMDLVRRERGSDGGSRRATLDFSGVGDDEVAVELAKGRGGLEATNGGKAATVDGTISWAGEEGRPARLELPEVRLRPGDTLQVKPRRWHDLAGSRTTVTVRDADGDVVSKRKVRVQQPDQLTRTRVRIKHRRAKGRKRTVVLRAVSVAVPAGSHLVQQVEIRKDRRRKKDKVVERLERVVPFDGGRETWRERVRLRDGRYRVVAVNTVVTVVDDLPVRDEQKDRLRVRLR